MKKLVSLALCLLILSLSVSALATGTDTDLPVDNDPALGVAVTVAPVDGGANDDMMYAQSDIMPISGDEDAPGLDVAVDDGEYVPSAGESLVAEWDQNGYPDDVGGVFWDSDTGKLTVMLVDPTDERKSDLLAQAPDIGFLSCRYSYNELLAVQDEIFQRLTDEVGIDGPSFGSGVGWGYPTGDSVAGFGESGKEFRVVVSLEQNEYDLYADQFMTQYGDKVYISVSDGIVLDGARADGTDGPEPAYGISEIGGATTTGLLIESHSGSPWPFVGLGALLLVAMGLIITFTRRRQHSYILQTAEGDTLSTSAAPVSRAQVAAAVIESTLTPDDSVWETIQSKIDS